VDEAERVARELNESVPPVVVPAPTPYDNSRPLAVAARAQTEASEQPAVAPPPQMTDTDVVRADAEPTDGRGVRFERASAMRARAGERVERLREASFVVLDEAQDDPALRFVLVTAVLFVLFLLILLLSHLFG
jgi:hypothetical protein